jgi:peptide/nickel transport system permease protein
LLFGSILGKDIFVINGIVLMLIITLAVAVFILDLIIPVLDPRIRHRT